jgi:predicted GNAT superfamily acetyltransferase
MSIKTQTIIIRDIERISEMRAVERLQKEVWGFDDLEVLPMTLMKASREVGAILVGAFDGDLLVGFAYGLIGLENGRVMVHSDMLAVREEYRNQNLGFRLKLAQRERALSLGLSNMTWTFDPLQSRNAHLNFARLGVVSDRYEINFYGEEASSFLHSDTDRLWVHWPLQSERVRQRIEGTARPAFAQAELEKLRRLVQCGEGSAPQSSRLDEGQADAQVLIEIPGDIISLEKRSLELGRQWREATRRAFIEALAAGYTVEEFYRLNREGPACGAYLLRPGQRC